MKTFEKVNGIKIPYDIVGRRPGDIATCYADTQKAENVLGWTSRIHGSFFQSQVAPALYISLVTSVSKTLCLFVQSTTMLLYKPHIFVSSFSLPVHCPQKTLDTLFIWKLGAGKAACFGLVAQPGAS